MKKMKKYEEFARRFRDSGMTRKAFAAEEGISVSMVGYYLKRAQEQGEEKVSTFTPVEVGNGDAQRSIVIKTAAGLEVYIPL